MYILLFNVKEVNGWAINRYLNQFHLNTLPLFTFHATNKTERFGMKLNTSSANAHYIYLIFKLKLKLLLKSLEWKTTSSTRNGNAIH